MADEQSGPPNKRRRPPTTIDLKATEVASERATPSEPVDPSPESAKPDAAAEPAPEQKPQSASSSGGPAHARGWRDRLDLSGMNARMAALRGSVSGRIDWRLIAAGSAGAAATLLAVLLGLWGAGAFRSDDQTAARLARLEQHVLAILNRPPPPSVDPRALFDLDARVGKAEAAAAAPRPAQPDQALTARVTALEAAVRPLAELRQGIDAANAAARDAKSRADAAFEAAQKASPPGVTPAQIEALTARVTALEQAAKSAAEKLVHTAGADRAGRLAFVATVLRGAVERGEPFAQELAAAKPLVADAAALSALEPFAATGVPRTAALARELSQLAGPMLSAAGAAPREGGILDRIQQNAERLVRIRPINEAPGDDSATVVARADVKAQHGDIAGALAELATLPPAVRAPAEGWIKKAQAQLAAVAAARKLANDAVGALSKAAP